MNKRIIMNLLLFSFFKGKIFSTLSHYKIYSMASMLKEDSEPVSFLVIYHSRFLVIQWKMRHMCTYTQRILCSKTHKKCNRMRRQPNTGSQIQEMLCQRLIMFWGKTGKKTKQEIAGVNNSSKEVEGQFCLSSGWIVIIQEHRLRFLQTVCYTMQAVTWAS